MEMQQEIIRQQQQPDPKDGTSSGGAAAPSGGSVVDLGSSSQVVASAVAALDGGPRFGLVLPTVVSGEKRLVSVQIHKVTLLSEGSPLCKSV